MADVPNLRIYQTIDVLENSPTKEHHNAVVISNRRNFRDTAILNARIDGLNQEILAVRIANDELQGNNNDLITRNEQLQGENRALRQQLRANINNGTCKSFVLKVIKK